MNEPVFVSRDQVLELHRMSLERHGGLKGLRDPGLLDSALMQPEATYYYGQGDLSAIAAAYAFHIAQNQPFIDGNKRSQLYDAMIAIAEKRLDKAGLAAVFRTQLAK